MVPAAPATVELTETFGSCPPTPEKGVPRPDLPPPLRLGDPRPETLALIGTVSLKLSGNVETSSASSAIFSLIEEQIEASPKLAKIE